MSEAVIRVPWREDHPRVWEVVEWVPDGEDDKKRKKTFAYVIADSFDEVAESIKGRCTHEVREICPIASGCGGSYRLEKIKAEVNP